MRCYNDEHGLCDHLEQQKRAFDFCANWKFICFNFATFICEKLMAPAGQIKTPSFRTEFIMDGWGWTFSRDYDNPETFESLMLNRFLTLSFVAVSWPCTGNPEAFVPQWQTYKRHLIRGYNLKSATKLLRMWRERLLSVKVNLVFVQLFFTNIWFLFSL